MMIEVYELKRSDAAIVIEQRMPDGNGVACVPLTAQRARLLRQLLREMLEEAGEAVMSNVTPLRPGE
jgi:hypothetical protein